MSLCIWQHILQAPEYQLGYKETPQWESNNKATRWKMSVFAGGSELEYVCV